MSLLIFIKVLAKLWRLGLLRMRPGTAWKVYRAWRTCAQSFALLAEIAAVRFGSAVALRDDDGCLTFAELRTAYETLARRLIDEFGAAPGHQVLIIERNHRTFIVALLATARAGMGILLANPDSPPKVIDQILSSHPVDIVLHGEGIALGTVAKTLRRLALVSSEPLRSSNTPLPRLRQAGRLVILTSGSTAAPKRISRNPTLTSLLPTVLGLLESLPVAMHQPTVLAVPIFHGHGLATLGMAMAFASPLHLGRKYEVAPLLTRDPSLRDAFVVSVPTLLKRWMASGATTGSVAAVVSGSAPLDERLSMQLIATLGPVLYNLYGSSEAGLISLASPEMLSTAPGTVGHPLPGTEVRIVKWGKQSDAQSGHQPAPSVTLGRIFVRGPLVLRADADGWFDTGDIGRIDNAQHLYVCGRSDGMFVSGGENVYPQEVEACLLSHPVINEAAITVIPDPEFGHRMRAFVVLHPGEDVTGEAIRDWLKARIDRCKIPKSIETLPALPRNPLGKIDRLALREIPMTIGTPP